jgi:hypothetical protein
MCNIVTFRFTCQHTLRHRRSRCGGTKHKVTANSVKAACIAESFLTIYLRVECGSCQHKAWDESWRRKLERAKVFLDKLRERDLPGAEEVAALIKVLDGEFAVALWDTRNTFAHGPKPSITRVQHNYYEKATSKLQQEVRPEDVVERAEKGWHEMVDEDYDGDYVASTDPIHPVSTDYSHPLDDDDGAWILQHLSPDDGDTAEPSDGIDFHTSSWNWGGSDHEEATQDVAETWKQEEEEEVTFHDAGMNGCSGDIAAGLVAWGPDVDKTSTDEISLAGLRDAGAEHSARVEDVVAAFWSVVNVDQHHTDPQSPAPPATPDSNTLHTLLHDLKLSEDHNTHIFNPSTPPTSPPQTPPWTDGPADSPPTSPPLTQIDQTPPTSPPPALINEPPLPPARSTTPPSANSTRSWYDKQRRILKQRREADIKKYYVDWLYISRCEIRDFEGPEGRMIREPLKQN